MNPSQAWAARQHNIDMMGARDLQPAGNPIKARPHPDDFLLDSLEHAIAVRVQVLAEDAKRHGVSLLERALQLQDELRAFVDTHGMPEVEQVEAFDYRRDDYWDETADWKDPEARW